MKEITFPEGLGLNTTVSKEADGQRWGWTNLGLPRKEWQKFRLKISSFVSLVKLFSSLSGYIACTVLNCRSELMDLAFVIIGMLLMSKFQWNLWLLFSIICIKDFSLSEILPSSNIIVASLFAEMKESLYPQSQTHLEYYGIVSQHSEIWDLGKKAAMVNYYYLLKEE